MNYNCLTKQVKRKAVLTAITLNGLLISEVSLAAAGATVITGDQGLAATGKNFGFVGASFSNGLQFVALAVGAGLIIYGITKLVGSNEGRGGAGSGLAMLLGGAALTSIIVLQGTVSETLFGADGTATHMQTMQ